MNHNFNRQFVLIDFRLLDDREFQQFLGSSSFPTYLILRRNIWRSEKAHYMGLHNLYLKKKKLASSIEREKISEVTGIDPDNISRHLTDLEKKGVIKRIRTGRQNIYILGEWVDVYGDGSYKVEWFYLEGKFGISKSDLTDSVKSDMTPASDQTRRKPSDNNIKENREENSTVNGGIKTLKKLKDLDQPQEKTEYVAKMILDRLGDEHSEKFYELVAAKVPEGRIRQTLSEIKVDGAESPPKVFTHRIKQWALKQEA